LYAAITAADNLPASATCIPCDRAQARIASDWPRGATLAGVGDCACSGLAFLAATLFVFTLPLALALFETVLVAEAFDPAAFVAVPGSPMVPEVAGAVATALRVVDFLGGAFVVALFATVAVRAAAFLVAVRRLEPVASLGLAAPVAVSAAFGSAGAALFRPGLRADVAFLSARFGFLVAPLALASKASATTASASSKVS
jgi:hypothetical protein